METADYEKLIDILRERCPEIFWRDDRPSVGEIFRNAIQTESISALVILFDSVGWDWCQKEMGDLSDSFRWWDLRERYYRSRNFISLLKDGSYWTFSGKDLKGFLPRELFENRWKKFRELRASRILKP